MDADTYDRVTKEMLMPFQIGHYCIRWGGILCQMSTTRRYRWREVNAEQRELAAGLAVDSWFHRDVLAQLISLIQASGRPIIVFVSNLYTRRVVRISCDPPMVRDMTLRHQSDLVLEEHNFLYYEGIRKDTIIALDDVKWI